MKQELGPNNLFPQTPEELEEAKKEAGVIPAEKEKERLEEILKEEIAKPEEERDKKLIENLSWILQNFETWQKEKTAKGRAFELLKEMVPKIFEIKPSKKMITGESPRKINQILLEICQPKIQKVLDMDIDNEEKLKKLKEMALLLKLFPEKKYSVKKEGDKEGEILIYPDEKGNEKKTWIIKDGNLTEDGKLIILSQGLGSLLLEYNIEKTVSNLLGISFLKDYQDQEMTKKIGKELAKENLPLIKHLRNSLSSTGLEKEEIDSLMKENGFLWDEKNEEYVEL